MYNRKYLKDAILDVTILQSRTVGQIKEFLEKGLANNSKTEIQVIARFIINKIKAATETADGRKANTIEKKIAKLKELGYEMAKDDWNQINEEDK